MTETLEVVNNEQAHRFEIAIGDEVAFAEYNLVEHGIILPHTLVPESLEGKGIGGQLARAALKYAREHDLKVIPTCPFMAAYITKHAEHHDQVHPDFRARLGIA